MDSNSKSLEEAFQKPAEKNNLRVYRAFYILFWAVSLFAFLDGDLALATSQLGVGLIFDPFDQTVPLPKRPRWQIAILVFHLLVLLTAFVLMFILPDQPWSVF